MAWRLTVLGSSSALPTDERMLSAQVLETEHHKLLFDCAEGTQFQLRKYQIKFYHLDYIFISHLHGDHFFGLFGLLNTLIMLGRKKPMTIFGPPDLETLVYSMLDTAGKSFAFPLNFYATNPSQKEQILITDELCVESIPLKHSTPTTGFYVVENRVERNFRKEKLEEYALSHTQIKQAKAGEDIVLENGKVLSHEELVFPKRTKRSFAYLSDTAYLPDIQNDINEVSLLYHEATFMEKNADDAHKKLHSTAHEAAKVAQAVQAQQLLVGHFSTRYKKVNELLKEAQTIFPNTIAAFDGQQIEIE